MIPLNLTILTGPTTKPISQGIREYDLKIGKHRTDKINIIPKSMDMSGAERFRAQMEHLVMMDEDMQKEMLHKGFIQVTKTRRSGTSNLRRYI